MTIDIYFFLYKDIFLLIFEGNPPPSKNVDKQNEGAKIVGTPLSSF